MHTAAENYLSGKLSSLRRVLANDMDAQIKGPANTVITPVTQAAFVTLFERYAAMLEYLAT